MTDKDFEDFNNNLNGLSQQSLIELFFDWYDYYNEQPTESTLLKLRALRLRIRILSTTGIKESKK